MLAQKVIKSRINFGRARNKRSVWLAQSEAEFLECSPNFLVLIRKTGFFIYQNTREGGSLAPPLATALYHSVWWGCAARFVKPQMSRQGEVQSVRTQPPGHDKGVGAVARSLSLNPEVPGLNPGAPGGQPLPPPPPHTHTHTRVHTHIHGKSQLRAWTLRESQN